MLKSITTQIFKRDLNKLKAEIAAYKDEITLWKVQKGISNSGGNLCLHLLGNLNHFVGTDLGNTGYVRNRDNEFAAKNIPKAELLSEIDKTTSMIETTLSKLSDADFEKPFPGPKTPMGEVGTGFFLVHLIAHLNYHLGQINYHRRLMENV